MATRISIKSNFPKRLFDIRSGIAAKEKALDSLADEAVKDFGKTVATWKNKPEIRVRETTNTRQVYVIGKIYGYVDQGTPPHIIRALRARVLSFRGGYKAKTRPGIISSSGGGASGKRIFARQVNHPGTKPRNFSRIIAERMQKKVDLQAKAIMRKYLSK